MAKKQSASSARAKRAGKSVKFMPDRERGRRVGRPKSGHAKQLIAIRIDPRLLAKLRQLAEKQDKPYQTLIHELLVRATKKAA